MSVKRSITPGRAAAAIVTVAAFTKSFVPFYLIGSTGIFVCACLAGFALIAINWREITDRAKSAKVSLLLAALLYVLVILNYLAISSKQVPLTYLVGLLAFHGLFLLFGFAAARYLRAIFAVMLVQGTVYLIAIAHYAITHGDVMRNGYLQDVFGIGVESLYIAFHQHIGIALSLALFAALSLEARWARLFAVLAMPPLLLFMFHIAARAALVALISGLVFHLSANLWTRSKVATILSLVIAAILTAAASISFYDFAIQDKNVTATAPDAISRTIRELQSKEPEFRVQIWRRAWERIETNPRDLLLGRGMGSYSIDEGFAPPTWLLDKSPKHYPHNTFLEMLYETGLAGLTLFGALTILPLIISVNRWGMFCRRERVAISVYVFYLTIIQLSGAFAYDYLFQFFLAVAIGVVGLRHKHSTEATANTLGGQA